MSKTTTLIVVIVVCIIAALSSLILSIWLYRRHKHKRRNGATSRGDYEKLQKRNRPHSPLSDSKHLSLSTTAKSSTRNSSISVSDYQKPDITDLEAQKTEYQSQSQPQTNVDVLHPIQIRRNTSLTSEYSLRPPHVRDGPIDPSQLLPQPDIAGPSPTAPPSNTNIPDRSRSDRVPNYHTDTEYSTLINEEVQTLIHNEPLPPPPIPRKSSRRGSEPFGETGAKWDWKCTA